MMDIDPETLSRVIAGIYEAAYDQSAWAGAIANLCNLFHGSKACLARIGPNLDANDSVATNADPQFQRRFIEEHSGQPNVFSDALFEVPIKTVYSDHALVGHEKLRRSRFWNEWMAPQDMYGGIGAKLLTSGPSVWFLDIQRGRGQASFEAGDVKLLQILVPHLARAVDINRRLNSTQAAASVISRLPFGVVVVDAFMRIRTANSAADAIFAHARSPLFSKSGLLTTADPKTMSKLQALVVRSCQSKDDIVPGLGGDILIRSIDRCEAHLSLSVGPTSPNNYPIHGRCAAVFIRKIVLDVPRGFEEQIRTLFELTAREAALATSLASGHTIRETAEDIGVAYSTLRTHLDSVFRKTETHQQSQLVALLRSLQPPMRQ